MRIGYSDDEAHPGQFALYRANSSRQIAGRKGQAALRDLERALLELPTKRLISGSIAKDGEVCAVGALLVLKRQGAGMTREGAIADLVTKYQNEDPEDDYEDSGWNTDDVAADEGVAPVLVAWRLVELNDVILDDATPEERYERVLKWVRARLVTAKGESDAEPR